MMIAWQLFKLAASQIGAFIIKHWRIILPLAMLCLCLMAYNKQVNRADKAELALSTYKADISKLTAKRERENEIKEIRANAEVKALKLVHDNNIAKVKQDYEKLNKISNITIANLRSELRNQVRTDSVSMPDFTSDTSTDSEVWRERYATANRQYQSLSQACTITTADFNALRVWADVACETVGCQK